MPKLIQDLKPQIEKQGAVACIPRHRKLKFPFDKEQYKNGIWLNVFFKN